MIIALATPPPIRRRGGESKASASVNLAPSAKTTGYRIETNTWFLLDIYFTFSLFII